MLFQVKSFIIGFPVNPQAPQNFQPAIGQATNRIIIGLAVGSNGAVVSDCPGRRVQGQASPLLNDMAEVAVTGLAEQHIRMLAAAFGEWAGACHRLQNGGCGVASAVITQLGKQSRSQQGASLGQTVIDLTIRVQPEELVQPSQTGLATAIKVSRILAWATANGA
jgi:hypothetical protein